MQLVVQCRCFFHKKFSSLYEAVRNWVWRDVQTQEVDVWGGWFFFPLFWGECGFCRHNWLLTYPLQVWVSLGAMVLGGIFFNYYRRSWI